MGLYGGYMGLVETSSVCVYVAVMQCDKSFVLWLLTKHEARDKM